MSCILPHQSTRVSYCCNDMVPDFLYSGMDYQDILDLAIAQLQRTYTTYTL